MARKTIRVEIPRTNPDTVLEMIAGILKKHKEMGNKSPLDKQVADALKHIYAKAEPIRKKAKEHEAKAQSNNDEARGLLGVNATQGSNTPGTGLYYLTQARDILLPKYKGNEEKLSEWAFDVVLGQAKSPKPRKPKTT